MSSGCYHSFVSSPAPTSRFFAFFQAWAAPAYSLHVLSDRSFSAPSCLSSCLPPLPASQAHSPPHDGHRGRYSLSRPSTCHPEILEGVLDLSLGLSSLQAMAFFQAHVRWRLGQSLSKLILYIFELSFLSLAISSGTSSFIECVRNFLSSQTLARSFQRKTS